MWFFLRPVEDFSKHAVIMVKCKSVYFACQEFLSSHRSACKIHQTIKKLSQNKGDLELLSANSYDKCRELQRCTLGDLKLLSAIYLSATRNRYISLLSMGQTFIGKNSHCILSAYLFNKKNSSTNKKKQT